MIQYKWPISIRISIRVNEQICRYPSQHLDIDLLKILHILDITTTFEMKKC